MSRIPFAARTCAAFFTFTLCVLLMPAPVARAQGVGPRGRRAGGVGGATRPVREPSTLARRQAARRPEIARLISEIDARNIERTIRKLVSFGTRNTLSAQDDPARGIGAARDWLFGEFQQMATQAQGRMTVEKQSYLQ
ncbi:MAG TPA: hypothetical protein VE842_06720, partial [Pyrinomonadaceae bacterium]|nr:hypothetical protein [Pyrinomonadaceae bacterium]